MVDAGAIGRMTNISPIFWKDGWPWWGTPDRPEHVPERTPKPIAGYPFAKPPSSDDFSSRKLGLQWQWNHNPDDVKWTLKERTALLLLTATHTDGIWHALTQPTTQTPGPTTQTRRR